MLFYPHVLFFFNYKEINNCCVHSDEIEAKNVLFGKNPSGFDYDRLPLLLNYITLLFVLTHIDYSGLRTGDGRLEREISLIKKLIKNFICLIMMSHMQCSRCNIAPMFCEHLYAS